MTKLFKQLFVFFIVILFLGGGYLAFEFNDLPSVHNMNKCGTAKMHKVYLCPDSQNYVLINEVSESFIQTLLMSEDGGFYSHNGFALKEIKNSVIENIKNLKYKRGASTISQQLIKNYFFSSNKSLLRKLKEAYLTFQMERVYSKDKILEMYINLVQFGPNMFGLKPASYRYFQKHPAELNLAESAALVYLLPNPEIYSQIFKSREQTEFSQKQMKKVIEYLHKFHKIEAYERDVSLAELDLMFKPYEEK